MWNRPFDTSMLGENSYVAVNCPEADLEREFAAILVAFGIKYPTDESPLKKNYWEKHRGNFCYYIRGNTVRYGSKNDADDYMRCTFYGEDQEDISDESFAAIIGR